MLYTTSNTSLHISKIALGTMQFLWTTTESEAYRLLDTFYEKGGNLIDTADMYTQWVPGLSGGEAETIIGNWMKKRKNRKNIVLSTKVRSRMWEGTDGEGLGRAHIIKACEESLRRLQTEYIDIYFSHWPDPATPNEETLETYQHLIDQGKIRFIGCSNYSLVELKETLKVSKTQSIPYSFIQTHYNLVNRKHFEDDLLPLLRGHSLEIFIYSPLAGGLLTGTYTALHKPSHARSELIVQQLSSRNKRILQEVEKLAKKYKTTVPQIALLWLLKKTYVTSILMGADTTEQLKENLLVFSLELSDEDYSSLNTIST